ncbi:hypothetical protein DFH11DRAFT_1630478 [Phellopilus nigrolimitatus]|nr:hypothetical protein DFH11DRAFT_1630478 [Phellopilus nigrolimitatus]
MSAVLDPETGFAPRLNACKKRLEDASEHLRELPRKTWNLLQTLMSSLRPPALPLPAKALLHRNPHTPTATLAQLILLHSPLLSELVVARE